MPGLEAGLFVEKAAAKRRSRSPAGSQTERRTGDGDLVGIFRTGESMGGRRTPATRQRTAEPIRNERGLQGRNDRVWHTGEMAIETIS
jgi:hypothetical protein